MSSYKTFLLYAVSVLALGTPIQTYAEQKQAPDRKELTQMHQEMAKRHNQAAKCLKAGKPVEECNQQAMKGCPMMKTGKCPFMGDGMGHGEGHGDQGGMMGDEGMMQHGGMMGHDEMPKDDQKNKEGASR